MLTRDLLRYHVRRGIVTPRFIDVAAPSLQQLVRGMIACVEGHIGATHAVLDDALSAGIAASAACKDVEPVIIKGLVKLLQDRCEFAESSKDYVGQRAALFAHATDLLRACPANTPMAAFTQQLHTQLGIPPDLYGDLPSNRPLLRWRPLSSEALLQRYNMAQVQGLIIACRTLCLRTRSRDVLRIRRVLRWLKFCRLLADIRRTQSPDEGLQWEVHVTGPAALFDQAKKYGLQLAQFVPAAFVLDDVQLEAEIALRPGKLWQLRLDHTAPLVSPHAQRLGHIPPEIAQVVEAFGSIDSAWQVLPAVEPRHVGAHSVMLPDLSFRHPHGREVHVELFHRWHHHALTQRIADLATRQDPDVLLGIDRSLLRRPELRLRLDAHPEVQTFEFSSFPTGRMLQRALKILD